MKKIKISDWLALDLPLMLYNLIQATPNENNEKSSISKEIDLLSILDSKFDDVIDVPNAVKYI